jgi:hypothetical protein
MRNACKILAGKPDRKKPLEKVGMDGKVILKRI